MEKLSFKYILENSHTLIRLTENGEKVKVVTGEIIEIEKSLVDRGRMFLAGFREVLTTGEVVKTGNDVALEENAKTAKEAEKEAKKAEKEAKKIAETIQEGNEVPKIELPQVETSSKDDGQDGVTIKVA